MEIKIISFTGHRPKELFGTYDFKNEKSKILASKLLKLLEKLISENKAEVFISGGALGFDQLAFFCVEKLKEKYPHIKNIVAVPYKDQPKAWEEQLKQFKEKGYTKAIKEMEMTVKRYQKMMELADKIVYVDEYEKYQPKGMKKEDIGKHSNSKLQLRNVYMVDHSELLISCYNGSPKSGTKNCIDYAKKNGKKIINLNPNDNFKIETIK